jgi:MOSC domain-containing protein YiiM
MMHTELREELRERGFNVAAGQMGENITTQGIDLLGLPTGARLRLGDEAVIEVTGLRNPCRQLGTIQSGLMATVLDRDANGALFRKAGVMVIVLVGGIVPPSDAISVELPPPPYMPLQPL